MAFNGSTYFSLLNVSISLVGLESNISLWDRSGMNQSAFAVLSLVLGKIFCLIWNSAFLSLFSLNRQNLNKHDDQNKYHFTSVWSRWFFTGTFYFKIVLMDGVVWLFCFVVPPLHRIDVLLPPKQLSLSHMSETENKRKANHWVRQHPSASTFEAPRCFMKK